MNWLTIEEIKQAAAAGLLPALQCSLEHHKQGRDVETALELVTAIKDDKFHIYGTLCACCVKYMYSGDICILAPKGCSGPKCAEGAWEPVQRTFNNFQDDHSNANFAAFQQAEADICKYIGGKIAEEKAKMCKYKVITKSPLKHGSLVKWNNLEQFYVVLNKNGELWWYSLQENKFASIVAIRDKINPGFTVIGDLKGVIGDIAALSEPLEEFEMKASGGCTIKGYEDSIHLVELAFSCRLASFTLENFQEFIENLRRIEVTLKAKQQR